MFTKALPGNAQASLALLGESKILDKTYLAGGSALALQLGHRISVDYDNKFGALASNLMHIQKSLVYFVDAEPQEMPKMTKPISWEEVKKFFEKTVRDLNL